MGSAFTAASLAQAVGARLHGDGERLLQGAAGLEEAGPGELTFFANPRYRSQLAATQAGAVLLDEKAAAAGPPGSATLLVCESPLLAYARALELFHPHTRPPVGIDPGAQVSAEAEVHPEATVMALCYVGPGATVGAGSVLRPQAHLGAGATLGEDCELHPHAVVGERCILGNRVVLQAGAVVGSDGFGYVLDSGDAGPFHRKILQVGIVRVEDDVEIGAGACVDRATTGETLIGRGSKIDNQVQVGHNCRIGPLSVLCGQSGLAGSTRLGPGVVLAGGVGVAGHIEIGEGARVGAGSGVISDVPAGETWTGYPAGPHARWLRASVLLRRLPELLRRLRAVERRLNEKTPGNEDP